jgi:hypothetical protein
MERRDLYQDDLTEERYPSPARRDDEAGKQTLDPDASADDGDQQRVIPGTHAGAQPGGDDEDDDEDDEDDEE